MLSPELLKILRCPETHQAISLAEASLIENVNRLITAGQLHNRAGQLLTEKIQGGLVRSDSRYLYPIRQNVPVMLINEAIPLQAE